MRKKKVLILIVLILSMAITVILLVKHNYELSPNYNFISAKLNIRDGDINIVNVGDSISTGRLEQVNLVAAKFGFKNIYLRSDSAKNEMKGIRNYNELMEAFLAIKNGPGWRERYQKELDSIGNDH
ncbi:MAG: hypothetical protein ABIW38_01830 [Ferruginibacter sp.]